MATADQMIHPDAQLDMAQRAGATTISVDASHAVAQAQPRVVAETIRQAVNAAVPA